ncbi:hypothetical protein A2W24_06470 [Microgenomates group bacterium RBG_16_45_19]|nr:MAG: hypothetical protein A2W24_06470 [Microgenomates group bacterium RBG_16_45_19]
MQDHQGNNPTPSKGGVRQQEQLTVSEGRFRNLLEQANDLIQSADASGRFVYVNPAWQALLGYSAEEARKLTFEQIIAPEYLELCRQVYERLKRGEVVSTVETVFVGKDRQRIIVEGNVSGQFNKGVFVATWGIFRNVTERKKTEEMLRLRTQELERMNALMVGREQQMVEMKRKYGIQTSGGVTIPVVLRQFEQVMVGTVMSSPVVTINEDESLLVAARMMAEKAVGALVVVTARGRLGIITERDFLTQTAKGLKKADKISVKSVMSSPVITVSPETTIDQASHLLKEMHIRRLPVVNQGQLVGIVTQTTLILALREQVITALKRNMEELKRMNTLMVGRELMMVKLKRRLQEQPTAQTKGLYGGG